MASNINKGIDNINDKQIYNQSNKFIIFSLLLIFLISFLVRLPFLNIPLERDEGAYAYIAQAMDRGEVPYRDIYDKKPLMLYIIYWIALHSFGDTLLGIHLFAYFYSLLSIFILYKLAKEITNKNTALVAAAIFAFISSERRLVGFSANAEMFMVLPIILSQLFIIKACKKDKYLFAFLSGVTGITAVWIKQPAILNMPVLLLPILYYWISQKKKLLWFLKMSVLILAGVLVFSLPMFVYLIKTNALKDFIYIVYLHNLDYVGTTSSLNISFSTIAAYFWARMEIILESQWVFWLLFVYSIIRFPKNEIFSRIYLFIWFLFSFIGVSLGFRFFYHYFQQITPAISVLAALGIIDIFRNIKKINNFLSVRIITVLFIILIIFVPINSNRQYYGKNTFELTRYAFGDNPFWEASHIAEYLSNNTSQEDKIWIVGSEPEILFYAKRKSASKYIVLYPVTSNASDVLEKQKEILKEIEVDLPVYIVVVNIQKSLLIHPNAPMYLFNEINQKILPHYVLDGTVVYTGNNINFYFGQIDLRKMTKEDYANSKIFLYRLNKT